ncbi:SDR family oxidoreductase [Cyclobacterium sediminis]
MTVSIIGMGWLGIPLAKALKEKGITVKGTTTNPEKEQSLRKQGFECEQLLLNPELEGTVPKSIFDTDILFINIPPSTRSKPSSYHPRQIEIIKGLTQKHGIKRVIYVSATSVYPNNNKVATEADPLNLTNTGNPALLTAENLLRKNNTYDLTVIRFGGLLGDDRIPGKYFSGKKDVPGHPPVNYIHKKDAVRAVLWIIEKGLWNETYNIVCPNHPAKKAVIEKNALDMGFAPPVNYENPEKQEWKEIAADKWCQTKFQFVYDNPLDFTYTTN